MNEIATDAFTLYRRRYFIIFSIFLLNLSNASIWNTFATIAVKSKSYYNVGFEEINILSLVYPIVTIPVGFFAIWSIDHVDIKKSVIAAAVINFIGGSIRLCSAIPIIDSSAKYPVALLGQFISSIAQAFFMFLPPKCAQCWYPDNQRALANTVGSLANPLGVLLGALMSPLVLSSHDMFELLLIYAVLGFLAMIVAIFSFTTSKPPTPPSGSAVAKNEMPFRKAMRESLCDKNYIVLSVVFGSAMGLFTLILALLAQILCPKGYDDTFAGISITLMIGCGFVGAISFGIVADKTKSFEDILKIVTGLAVFFLPLFVIFAAREDAEIMICIILSFFGFFGFGLYALFLETAVETTYPVPEATSTGLMIIFGQFLCAVFIFIFQETGTKTTDLHTTCSADAMAGSEVKDYLYGNIFMAVWGFFIFVLLLLFYKCPYKRLEYEKTKLLSGNALQLSEVYLNEVKDVRNFK